ncbi:MAG: REP-associated tyrosine transposase [Sphingomonadales bacterium]|jgi:putative transposase|nr:REP-associated tyrosine transposase [Sphingomonadales bacterium]
MPNHVHLLLVPERPGGLAAAIGRVHRRYALEMNRRRGWHGAFWQGRFGSVPLDEPHLHVCFRYVELNPVRARLADRPEAWRWSSARAHLGLAPDPLTDLAPARERIHDWRAFLDSGLDPLKKNPLALSKVEGRPARRRTHRPPPLGFPLGTWHRTAFGTASGIGLFRQMTIFDSSPHANFE